MTADQTKRPPTGIQSREGVFFYARPEGAEAALVLATGEVFWGQGAGAAGRGAAAAAARIVRGAGARPPLGTISYLKAFIALIKEHFCTRMLLVNDYFRSFYRSFLA